MKGLSLVFLPLVLLLIFFNAGVSFALTINVTTTTDEFGAGAGCSLREAIQAANIDGAFGGCTAGAAGSDDIVLPAGTYNLTIGGTGEDFNATGDLDISSPLNILGAGSATTTIDASTLPTRDRVLHKTGFFAVGISGVTITGGFLVGVGTIEGGGIYQNAGTLTLDNSTVSGNYVSGTTNSHGGGIYQNGGTLNVTNSTISGNNVAGEATSNFGGGIYQNGGTLNITDSTLSANSAAGGTISLNQGGGIYQNGGTVTIIRSTLSANFASGATSINRGGGIYQIVGTLNVNNSTLSGNFASLGAFNQGGGIYSFLGNTAFNFSTINANTAAQGGGVYRNGGTVQFRNTIISGSAPNCFPLGGAGITSFDYNLDDGATCGFAAGNDQTNTPPALGPLANNGGPTQTHALTAGSPAIDTADPGAFPGTDQRGIARPIDGDGNGSLLPDIGAFEAPLFVAGAGGGAFSTPTLSGWGMIIFALLAGLCSLYYLRRTKAGA